MTEITKEQALYRFFSGFGIPAYEENSVYDLEEVPSFPYITYEVKTSCFDADVAVGLSCSVWYYSTSWVECNEKAREIEEAISSGLQIKAADGSIFLTKGNVFSTNFSESSLKNVKRKLLDIRAMFFTS